MKDWCNNDGARRLKEKIAEYWSERGYDVEVDLVDAGFVPAMRSARTDVRAIMVGDAWTDERAARDARLPFVFVSFGYGTLSDQPYDRLRSIDHWRDMQQALSELARPT